MVKFGCKDTQKEGLLFILCAKIIYPTQFVTD